MKKLVLFFSVVTLISCNLNTTPQNKIPGRLDSISIKRETPLQHQKPETIIGLYENGHFTYCDHPETSYSVNGKTNTADSLYRHILPNAYQHQNVSIKLIGYLSNTVPLVLHIDSIIKMERKSSKNACIPYEYWCYGTEPFWQIEISKEENLIDFYDPMEQKTTHFIYSKPEIKNGITYYTVSDKENKISIAIKKEKCNGAIDPQYDYSVQVQLNNKKYNGCAEGVYFVKAGEPVQ